MNTLILYIPFSEGAILISDRQSTRVDGTREQWDKIYHIDNYNAVIGFSGHSEASRSIAQNLQRAKEFKFVDHYKKAYKASIKIDDEDIDALCIIKRGSSIESYKFTGVIINSINLHDPTGIGSGEPFIRPHLERNTDIFDLDTVIDFGKTLIRYSSKVSGEVGPPAVYGFGIAIVSLHEDIKVEIMNPQQISLEKVLYKFPE